MSSLSSLFYPQLSRVDSKVVLHQTGSNISFSIRLQVLTKVLKFLESLRTSCTRDIPLRPLKKKQTEEKPKVVTAVCMGNVYLNTSVDI